MPSNQSSPWSGGKPRDCSGAVGHAIAHSVSATLCTHDETAVASGLPHCQPSVEFSRRKDLAKPLPANVASSAAPDTEGRFTAVPDCSLNLPRLHNAIQVPAAVLKPAEAGASSSLPNRGCRVGFGCAATGTVQVSPPSASLQTSQLQKSSVRGRPDVASVEKQTGLQPLLPVCHQDLFIRGQSALPQANKFVLEAADCYQPSLSPLCLALCEHRRAALGKEYPGPDATKLEKRSPAKEASRRSHSVNVAKKCNPTQSGCTTTTDPNNQLQVKGGPAAALVATTKSVPPTPAPLHVNEAAPASPDPAASTWFAPAGFGRPEVRPVPNGPVPTSLGVSVCATREQQPTPPDVVPDMASVTSVTPVGSVTTQISAIHLTKREQPASASSSSSSPSLSPVSPEECLVRETQPSGTECAAPVDGGEEELPDELEDFCSDDYDSDCSSINGASSTSSIGLSGIEEPMSLGAEDARDERPALVPSLFPLIPPTLYFSSASEKVELLPVEQRRLLKWKMSTVTPNVVKHTLARSHFKVTKKSHDWLGCWGHHMKSPGFKALGEHQKLNHFPGTFQIGRKDRLWRNLSKMQVRFGKLEFSFFPRTFVLPQDIKLLRKAWEDSGPRQKWIIKPPASARGIGIQVIHRWSQLPRKRPLLVQKYLHKPYLIGGNKFDLRIYVYVTSYDPLRIYIFTDGLVRFASCKYSSSMKTLGNKFMHLTNYSVNKKNSEYQTNSDDKACQGHKWALKALWQFLGAKGVNTTLIWEKIKDIVIKTIIASEPYVHSLLKMHVRTPYSCHELFGFDIMLDENLKPWILEVNISPSLHSNTALDASIKGQMIRDLLNLAGFRIPQREEPCDPCSSVSSSTSSLCGGNRERTRPDLSADEKVKRAFYLTQRYPDQDLLSTALDVLTPEDVRVLAESEDELTRRGQFERIFPSPSSSRYLRFFECPRYPSILLDQWERKYWSDREKGIGLLRTLCRKGVHLGTSDPAHIWSKCGYISRFDVAREDLSRPSRGVVIHHQLSRRGDNDCGSDGDVASVSSLPVSPSPGSSVTSSACASPQPGLQQSLLPCVLPRSGDPVCQSDAQGPI